MGSIWTPGGEHPVDRGGDAERERERQAQAAGAGGGGEDDLSPEQAAELQREMQAMQEEVARTPANVVIANHAVGLFQLAAIHLNQRPPNLDDGRLAIDALAALLEGLKGRLGEEEQALDDALSQLRIAYVSLVEAGDPEA